MLSNACLDTQATGTWGSIIPGKLKVPFLLMHEPEAYFQSFEKRGVLKTAHSSQVEF